MTKLWVVVYFVNLEKEGVQFFETRKSAEEFASTLKKYNNPVWIGSVTKYEQSFRIPSI